MVTKRAIVGLGNSGRSVIQYFATYFKAEDYLSTVTAFDTRKEPPGIEKLHIDYPELNTVFGDLNGELLATQEQIILSPGVSIYEPAIQYAISAGVEVINDIELFARAIKGDADKAAVVAVTGSNGKSTVVTLLAKMGDAAGWSVRAGGNLGVPALDLLSNSAEKVDLYILELSSFQLETDLSLAPKAAVLLNISADHLDRYRDIDHYGEIKGRIYSNAETLVYPLDIDGDEIEKLVESGNIRAKRSPYGGSGKGQQYSIQEHSGNRWIFRGEERIIELDEVAMVGEHNYTNALAALSLGEAVNIPLNAMLTALKEFRGLEHRTELVAERGGVRWINDSKGTNVGATEAAILGLGEVGSKIVLIAGGQGKGADFTLLRALAQKFLRGVVLLGEDAQLISAALGGVVEEVMVDDMESAVARASKIAQIGDSVLLSPACASFDQFSGFEDRGNRFKDAVNAMEILA
jgi:UDP-N-acetylmuramoylalanine--D-glutamate ligase